MPKLFVYIETQTGVAAQIWHSDQVDGGGKQKPTLLKVVLPLDQEQLSINRLKEIYPLEQQP